MRTDIAVEKLCNVMPTIAEMAEKLKASDDFKKFLIGYKDKKTNKVFMLKVFPLLLKLCENEVYEILATMFDKEIEEVKGQPITDTITQAKRLFSDEDFKSFFSLLFKEKEQKAEK